MIARHNLARRPHENRAPWWLAAAALLLLVLLRVGFSMPGFSAAGLKSDHEQSLAKRRARIAGLKQEKERLEGLIRSDSWRRFAADAAVAETLLSRRNFSWLDLLARLEECKPYESYLTSIHPAFGKEGDIVVELTGHASSHAQLLDMEKRFMASPYFEGLVLKADERTAPSSAEFEFTVSVMYLPEGGKAERDLPVTIGITPKERRR